VAFSSVDLEKHRQKRFVIEPWDQDQLSPLGYDLRIGFVINPVTAEELYPKGADSSQMVEVRIKARESVVVVTLERIYLTGSVIGTVHARSGISAKGILVNSVTVDPLWNGRLILTFYNSSDSDVCIRSDKGMATLILHSTETPTRKVGHKSETKQLLQDNGRYSHEVNSKIVKYLHEYKNSKGESAYREARDQAKQFSSKGVVGRALSNIRERAKLIDFAYYALLSMLAVSIVFAVGIALFPERSPDSFVGKIEKRKDVITIAVLVITILTTAVIHNGSRSGSRRRP